jgi:nucleotide-binding universal stress UspA family protein
MEKRAARRHRINTSIVCSYYDLELAPEFKKQAAAAVRAEVNKNLLAVEKTAKEAGVPCETAQETSDQPYEAIVEAARKKGCDLIIKC